ncbi:MAG TPA: 30S ribosome-binding factor RbfA [Bacillota bacterium]|nr:30S ribosome-binding factor RbfA [Bacillota bacterium]HPF42469.1 30S ribosome-binding factor RbfA [Bacillota bacterium]HPJ85764.1 30S ribosome-binding factor RbfA [Bacillota bacterium]HPQ61599.1 30S ribosome-binding factor RbfA [Bacillota bacterium]HRX91488.1 30S ribosome-binding factor RbfA [Candidatus Izemoplasmatales bacterium]
MAKTDRLDTLVQRVCADIIKNEVKDDLGFITVTGARVTNDLSYMYVYYTIYGDNERREKTQAALERAKGFIRGQIAMQVKMRKVPELIFKYDQSDLEGRKVDEIIRRMK